MGTADDRRRYNIGRLPLALSIPRKIPAIHWWLSSNYGRHSAVPTHNILKRKSLNKNTIILPTAFWSILLKWIFPFHLNLFPSAHLFLSAHLTMGQHCWSNWLAVNKTQVIIYLKQCSLTHISTIMTQWVNSHSVAWLTPWMIYSVTVIQSGFWHARRYVR